MRILKKDLRHNIICISLDDIDDLWILYNVVEPGDLLTSRTTREIKAEQGRPSSQRVALTLTIEVTKVEFDASLNRLRIHGIVRECPEEYGIKGSHHTITAAPSTSMTIRKERWRAHHLERLESAARKDMEPIVIVSLDGESGCIALIRAFKVDVKVEVRADLPGKMDLEARSLAERRFLGELARSLLRLLESEPNVKGIVITGPGFLKERLKELLDREFPDVASKISGVKGGSSGGVAGVYEALRSGTLEKLLRDSRIAKEVSAVEKLLAKMGSDSGDFSYGLDQVAEDASSGAVETLLVADSLLRCLDLRDKVEHVLRDVEEKGGKIMILSTEHEGGEKLSSLGGIAALLRYKRHGWG
ncbi:MAG: mRNA surveillance protein pelota [Candidatus Bathyarchaeia archaeon]|nr:mRNA surveillance protein pelota [Candidatus Bathyarchaeota archaeon]